jgi:NADPH-dependent glutamate synthase beta subunit-like oxidoreductase/glutamate synthase domain-containing protein 3/NAD-dependent dihydropyrimidine dehydrogenase PreA subunit
MPAKKKDTRKKAAPAAKAKATDKSAATDKGADKAVLEGNRGGARVSSREFEDLVQAAVKAGARTLTIKADGQHGIGGRLWTAYKDEARTKIDPIRITVEGVPGQRLGSMGFFGTEITVKGSASDDTGWINCGSTITVLGDVTNGAHNAAAQGRLYVQGGGGARCDTMTKQNPRFAPPESWYFRDMGDSFAEFKAGGIAVVCGVNPRHPDNILGYRPCVGMVGGTIYFRGPIKETYSRNDVQVLDLTPQDWAWLTGNMKPYLKAIRREEYYEQLTREITDWKKIIAYTPAERSKRMKTRKPMTEFRLDSWDKAVGSGGIFGPFITHDRTSLPYVTTGEDRRNRPVWANEKYLPPCAFNCPTGIPSHTRAKLIRDGKVEEALALVLEYSPLPASVCGEVCPNLCMDACTRGQVDRPLNIKEYGRLALDLPAPKIKARKTGYTIGVIGGGPAGLSAAWQLALKGHTVNLYESADKLGGKIELAIPRDRMPQAVLAKELSRFREVGVKVHEGANVDKKKYAKIHAENDVVVVACGAHAPRQIPFPGSDDVTPAIQFLKQVNFGEAPDLKGKAVAIIGAGNVGMDVALQAWNCGAASVTAIDVQKPAAFGHELEMAMKLGTQVLWPKFTEKFSRKDRKLSFKDGTSLKADVVIMSVGEVPVLDFLPPAIHTERGWIKVNEKYQTSDVKVYAVGDAVKPGLITHAIGHGRVAADVIHATLMQFDYMPEVRIQIPYARIKREYYDIARDTIFAPKAEANVCMSCGLCRDCHMCEATCYVGAISRRETESGRFEYVVDAGKCIGCGFCAGVCPCGVWEMEENI